MCIFENDTVKRDCLMQENYEIFKDLIQTVGVYLTSFIVFMEILKKKGSEKKSSENDQSTGHFRVFSLLFFILSTLNLIFSPVNQLIKKNLA